jgi:hypothetical protein
LTSVSLPSTIKKVEWRAFDKCSVLTTFTIPDSVTEIEFDNRDYGPYGSFSKCPKLTLASQAALKKRGYTGTF